MMIFLELFKSVLELKNIKSMIGVEVTNLEVLGHFFLLIENLLDFSTTSHRFIQYLLHYFITTKNIIYAPLSFGFATTCRYDFQAGNLGK